MVPEGLLLYIKMAPEFFCPLLDSFTPFVIFVSVLGLLVSIGLYRSSTLVSLSIGLMTSASCVAIVSVVFSYAVDVCELVSVKSVFTETQKLPEIERACYIDREELHNQLTRVLVHDGDVDLDVYYLVVGPHGSGKSTALVNVVHNHHHGIKYLCVPNNCEDFGDYLAKEFSIDLARIRIYKRDYTPIQRRYRYVESFIDDKSPQTMRYQVQLVLNIIQTAATAIFEEEELAPTLIFDNLGHLLTCGDEGKQTLFSLQDFAKFAADMGFLNIVFASSEGAVASMFLKRSSSSRMVATPFIGDISSKQAMDYLRCRAPSASNGILTEIVQLVGGRFIDLNTAVSFFKLEMDIHALRTALYARVQNEIKRLNITLKTTRKISDTHFSNVTWSVAQEIIKSKEQQISTTLFYEKADSLSIDEQETLLSANLFMTRGGLVEFQSTVVKSYFIDSLSSNSCRSLSVCKEV